MVVFFWKIILEAVQRVKWNMGKLVAEGWLGDRIQQVPQWCTGTVAWAPEDFGTRFVWLMPKRACACMHAKLLSRVWLCDLMDCSSSGYSVHGIFQAKILKWVTVPSSRGSSPPRDRTCVSYVSCFGRQILSLPLAPPGKPRGHGWEYF